MGLPRSGLRRNAACSLAILAVIATISLGLPALDRAFPREQALVPGTVYEVTDGVTVVPPAGARLDVSQTRPGRTGGYAVFLVGRVRFAILVTPDRITLAAAADRLRTRLRDAAGASPTGAQRHTPSGALAGRFRAGADGGWYAVRVLGSATVVDATASGPPDELSRRLPAIEAAVASIARAA